MKKALWRSGCFVVLGILLLTPACLAARKEITYWTFLDPRDPGPRSAVQNHAIELFKKQNPDYDVRVEVLQWDKIASNLIIAARAGRGPDLVRVFQPDFQQVVAAGALAPLDEFVSSWSPAERDDWVIPWEATVVGGHKYGLFWDTRVRHLWYRKDILDQAGIPVPDSLEALAQAGQRLARPGLAGVMVTFSRKYATSFGEWFLPTLVGAGGQLIDASGAAAFHGPAGEKVFKWLYDLVHTYGAMPRSAVAMSYEEMYQAFLAGTVVFFNSGSHRVAEARADSGLGSRLQTAPWPGFKSGEPSPAWTTGWILAIGAHSSDKPGAWRLMQAFLSPEVQLMSARIAGEMPSRKSILRDPWFASPEASEMRQWLAYASDYPLRAQLPEKWALMFDALAQSAEEMIVGQVAPKEALARAAERYNRSR